MYSIYTVNAEFKHTMTFDSLVMVNELHILYGKISMILHIFIANVYLAF